MDNREAAQRNFLSNAHSVFVTRKSRSRRSIYAIGSLLSIIGLIFFVSRVPNNEKKSDDSLLSMRSFLDDKKVSGLDFPTPGSLHGHFVLPNPLQTVESASEAAHLADQFHHQGHPFDGSEQGPGCSDKFGPCGSEVHSESRSNRKFSLPAPVPKGAPSNPPAPQLPKPRGGHGFSHNDGQSDNWGNVWERNTKSLGLCFQHAGCYVTRRGHLRFCPPGFYCPAESRKPVGCPANSVSEAGADNVTDCFARPGFYGARGEPAELCPPRFYCESGAEYPEPCPNNTFSRSGAKRLTDCVSLPGYRGSPGAEAVICSNDTYCPAGQDQLTRCPPNTESPRGSDAPTDCVPVPGTYGRPGHRAHFCPAGHFCPRGALGPSRCPPNTNSTLGSDEIADCMSVDGFYGPPGEAAALCPAGSYCPKRSPTAVPCPTNTWSPLGSFVITACKSKPGYYGGPGVAAVLCPADSYCLPDRDFFTACPANTQAPAGSDSVDDCTAMAGFYSPRAGEPALPCPAGFFCPAGAERAQACPSNTESQLGSSVVGDCTVRAGYYGAQGEAGTPCPAGSYCRRGAPTPAPCPYGTSSPPAAALLAACASKAGFYGSPGTAARLCPTGAFCPSNQDYFTACPANTTSPEGSEALRACAALPGFFGEPGRAAQACPPDFYCPAGAVHPAGCPANTFAKPAASMVDDCKAQPGYDGPWGQSAVTCDVGTYCPAASTAPNPCPSGTTSAINSERRRDCLPLRGFFGTPGTAASPCIPGSYCPGGGGGADASTPLPCPPHTNSPAGAGGLLECGPRAGYYGADGVEAALCPRGHYCPSRAPRPTRCPDNTDSEAGSAQPVDCRALPGYYGAAGAAAQVCLADQWCPGGGDIQRPCPAFTTSPEGSSKAEACVAVAGYYGPPGAPARRCPAKSYCPGGSLGVVACPNSSPISPEGSALLSACRPLGWNLKLYRIPVGTNVMPALAAAGSLLGQSNLAQAVDVGGLGDMRALVPACPDGWYAWSYEGVVAVAAGGAYELAVQSDDGSLLWLDPTPLATMDAGGGGGGVMLSPEAVGAPRRYEMLVDDDGLHGPVQRSRVVTLGPGAYAVRVVGFQALGGVFMRFTYKGPDTGDRWVLAPSIDSRLPAPASGSLAAGGGASFLTGNGWTLQVFTIPAGTRETPTVLAADALVGQADGIPAVSFDSDGDVRRYVPAAGSAYAWRFYGNLRVRRAGAYQFCSESDDGSLFYLDNVSAVDPGGYSLLLDNDGVHGVERVCAAATLAAGVYRAKLTGFQWGGGMAMRLFYRGPDTDNQQWFLRSDGASSAQEGGLPDRGRGNGAWSLQVFALPPGTVATPRNFYGRAPLGRSDRLPRLRLDSLDDFRRFVPQTPPAWYAWMALGRLAIEAGGQYSLCTRSDDGSLLYARGGPLGDAYKLLVVDDGLHGPVQRCKSLALDTGTYDIKVTGFQGGGGVYQDFTYSGPDTGGRERFARSADSQAAHDACPSFKDPSNPTPPGVFSQGLYARYTYRSWDGGQLRWADVSGNNRHGAARGAGFAAACDAAGANGAAGSVCALRGTPASKVDFGAGAVPPTFTICSVTRYAGPARGRILNGQGNWLHGHWSGNVGVAFYEGWKTPAGTPISLSVPTDWLLMCGQNAAPNLMTANAVPVSNGAAGGAGGIGLGINTLPRYGDAEASDWAAAEIAIWDRALSAEELEDVMAYYS